MNRHIRHVGEGLLVLFEGEKCIREIGVTPGWDFKDRDEIITAFNNRSKKETFHSMKSAPKDGTMIRLLVEFEEHDVEDGQSPHWTIGAWPGEGDENSNWQFAGWCWTHDHFTEGKGIPIGWLPMLGD